jgi:hypothetical protein
MGEPLEEVKIKYPEEPKCSLVLLLDASSSIKRVKIALVTFEVRITDGSSRGVGEN